MRIRELSWKNYRRIPDGRIEVRRHLVLLGPNDSGKSSILRAVNVCLGVPAAHLNSVVEPRDFTQPDQPLVLRVVLVGFDDDDRAAFPDEIETIGGESLTVEVEASMSGDDEQKLVRRRFPFGGHQRSASRVQMDRFGWAYVPASRSLYRELGTGSTSVIRALLASVDLEADKAAFEQAADVYRAALDSAAALTAFRQQLATALDDALPRTVTIDDLGLLSEADLAGDPLSGVTVTVSDGEHRAPLSEQSDGVRAMSLLTLLGMTHHGARIVGIDEPEIHLHHTAQRAIASRLRSTTDQVVLATHAPAVVQEMDPLDIVAFGADRLARQLPPGAGLAALDKATRHWVPNLIEPLTARSILLVEGPSDRLICDRVASHQGIDLNRAGVATFELNGSGLFDLTYRLFGPAGFSRSLFALLDEDARSNWAQVAGVPATDLETDGRFYVCDPDLEGVYVAALGVTRVLELLVGSSHFTEHSICTACGGIQVEGMTDEILAKFCRHKSRKMRAALAVAAGLNAAEAAALTPVVNAVRAASS